MKSLAVAFITWMAFGMLRAKNWYQKWETKLEGKLQQQQADNDAAIVEKGKATEFPQSVVEVDDRDTKVPGYALAELTAETSDG
jgi:high-affinity Fe2+/Pb2+ permease